MHSIIFLELFDVFGYKRGMLDVLCSFLTFDLTRAIQKYALEILFDTFRVDMMNFLSILTQNLKTY